MQNRCPTCHRSYKQNRSNNQNAYYWGVIIELLSEHTGFERDEMHEVLKHKFLRYTVWIPKKEGVKEQSIIAKSTTKLTTKQFEEYQGQIRQWASSDLGLFLPEPHEVNYANT